MIQRARFFALGLICLTGLTGGATLAGQSAGNGVYGGYVGSDKWFSNMRQSAANMALMRNISGHRSKQLPAGYVEAAGRIAFPKGNPFPGGRFPDLRITCRTPKADPVERTPFLDKQGTFYTVFKKGQSYDFYWMYYFGSKEKFASVAIRSDAPRRYKLTVVYKPSGQADTTASDQSRQLSGEREQATKPSSVSATEADIFDLSGFPQEPADFEEQQVMEAIQSATTPALKAQAHEKIARYYEKKGLTGKAESERAKAEYWRSVR